MVHAKRLGRYELTEGVLAVSSIFQGGKAQVPSDVRRKLGLEDGDKIVWVHEAGRIYVESATRFSR